MGRHSSSVALARSEGDDGLPSSREAAENEPPGLLQVKVTRWSQSEPFSPDQDSSHAHEPLQLRKYANTAKTTDLEKIYFPLHMNGNYWIAGIIHF